MIDDITIFLPKYPNIEKLESEFLNLYEDNFNETIYKKKEFYDLKLEEKEEFPTKQGELFNHQKIISRFLSSKTLYNNILLVHEMGTGKTCSAVSAIEQIKNEKPQNYKGALILASGDGLLNNFLDEIIFKCTDGKYIPEYYDKLTENERIRRKRKSVKNFYEFDTFEVFAKKIKNSNKQNLIDNYSNRIIIIDEVHNLRNKEKSKIDMYGEYHKFLHTIKNCKLILMSGTPMKDEPE